MPKKIRNKRSRRRGLKPKSVNTEPCSEASTEKSEQTLLNSSDSVPTVSPEQSEDEWQELVEQVESKNIQEASSTNKPEIEPNKILETGSKPDLGFFANASDQCKMKEVHNQSAYPSKGVAINHPCPRTKVLPSEINKQMYNEHPLPYKSEMSISSALVKPMPTVCSAHDPKPWLATEFLRYDVTKLQDVERAFFEHKYKRSAPVEDDSAHSAADKPASKPDKKEKKKAGSSKKETKPVEKVWSNKADCDDAETKLQERLAQPEYRNPANGECTFIMLKPDAVHRGLVGTIISRFESRGFKLLAAKFMRASKPLLETHYSDLAKKGFFPELIRYMGSGPVVPMVWQGLNAVKQGRVMLGATNPKDSAPGTIRGDFCVDVGRNIIHGSDSVESAEKEIKLWFTQQEISSWRSSQTEWVYEEEELKGSLAEQVDGLVANVDEDEMALASKLSALELENKQLKKVTDDLKSLILRLEGRVTSLEGGKAPAAKPAAEDDDDDVDLFGSDDDNEEVDAEKARITAERLKAYAEKKSKKPALIAKTSVLFDVKPWDDETDLDKMLECCKSIQMDGLVWGASKKVPIGYGIEKLQVMCIVEDEKVSIEELGEKIEEFEDYVQSVDVAAMNKI